MKFRTKPVEVDAIKVDDVLRIEQEEDKEGWDALPEWLRRREGDMVITHDNIFIVSPGLAKRRGEPGDWLVYSGNDIYVFKPGIFAQLYEVVP